jgi:hypothetical protein
MATVRPFKAHAHYPKPTGMGLNKRKSRIKLSSWLYATDAEITNCFPNRRDQSRLFAAVSTRERAIRSEVMLNQMLLANHGNCERLGNGWSVPGKGGSAT